MTPFWSRNSEYGDSDSLTTSANPRPYALKIPQYLWINIFFIPRSLDI